MALLPASARFVTIISTIVPKEKRMSKAPVPNGIKPGPGAPMLPIPMCKEERQNRAPKSIRRRLEKSSPVFTYAKGIFFPARPSSRFSAGAGLGA
jgi:hypothetical protein